ncbi:hypothetical protein CCACVL1_12308, partial [Corchorus capsularis]
DVIGITPFHVLRYLPASRLTHNARSHDALLAFLEYHHGLKGDYSQGLQYK